MTITQGVNLIYALTLIKRERTQKSVRGHVFVSGNGFFLEKKLFSLGGASSLSWIK